jgi:hypothetical protein
VDLGNPDPTPIIEAPAPPVVVPVPRERNEGGGQASSAGTGQSGGAGASSSASGPPGTGRDTLPDRAAKASPERVSSPASGQVGAAEASSGNRAPAPDDGGHRQRRGSGLGGAGGQFPQSRERAGTGRQPCRQRLPRLPGAATAAAGRPGTRVRVGTEQTRGAAEEIQARPSARWRVDDDRASSMRRRARFRHRSSTGRGEFKAGCLRTTQTMRVRRTPATCAARCKTTDRNTTRGNACCSWTTSSSGLS